MLKFELKKIESGLEFRVLEQSENIINYLPFAYRVLDKDLVKIHSQSNPEILNDTDGLYIFLRGTNKTYDNIVSTINFQNNTERDIVFDISLLAFKELSKNWKND